jgi:hypothetical protein
MSDFKTSDRDVNRVIRSWLHEDRHEDVSRIAGRVLDQVDTIPQRRATWWPARRTLVMNKIVTIGLGAAAVVVLAIFIGAQLLGSPSGGTGSGATPTPTPTIEPTTNPTSSPGAEGGLPEGPFLILSGQDDNGETLHPPLTVTIPAPGWDGDEGGGILLKDWVGGEGAEGMIIFAGQEYLVFDDPCNWASTPGTTVTTVDEFVAALAAQHSRDASEPVDITVAGYPGKSITLHLPDDPSQCDEGIFGMWNCGDPAEPIACGFSDPGETSVEYIFDVDGVLFAWHTDYEDGAPADAAAENEAIVQSASFGE